MRSHINVWLKKFNRSHVKLVVSLSYITIGVDNICMKTHKIPRGIGELFSFDLEFFTI